jgi:outer membrane protein assembly factor BamB
MPAAPSELTSVDLGLAPLERVLCADVDDDGAPELLYGAFPLICCSLSGKEKWRCAEAGEVRAVADFDADRHTELLAAGRGEHDPLMIRGRDGEVVWRRTGPGTVAGYRHHYHAARLLPGVKGVQIACVTEEFGANAKIGQVWRFDEGCRQAHLVWERPFAVWEHAGATVGRLLGNTPCLISPTWGGIIVLDARTGKELLRLYWEEAPGKAGLRNYGSLRVIDLDGDGRRELVILAPTIAQHLNVFALQRGGPGDHTVPEKPWPAPPVALGELASYPEGPILWRRYWGTRWPQDPFLIEYPDCPIADVDGDGKQEIIAVVGRERWELKVYHGTTGAEKLTLPGVTQSATVCDFDGDGAAEIAVTQEDALVIGSLRGGTWEERLRVPGARLWQTAVARSGTRLADPYHVEQQPVSLGAGPRRSWIATRTAGEGRPAELLRLRAGREGRLEVSPLAAEDAAELQPLAASRDRLVVATRSGTVRALDPEGKRLAEWPAGSAFVTQPAVADLDGDGRNEIVACRPGGKLTVLRHRPSGAPERVWETEGSGLLTCRPTPYPTPLIADVDGDGKKEILIVDRGLALLDSQGRVRWRSPIDALRATFGDFDGDGHLDVYAAARAGRAGSIGVTVQSFALDGRTGKPLWHNDGAAEIVWHHELGPQHRQPTVFDIDGDGRDDVLFVALDLLVELNGRDGSFMKPPVIANEVWKQREGANGQWTAYGTHIPLDLNGDGKIELLLAANWGQWGAWTLDRKLLWTFNPEKAQLSQRHPGIGDVDGDGKLELGVLHDGGFFRCYDATNGRLKWEIAGVRQATDVVTADVDGDGRPEFLVGLAAFKAVDEHHGRLLWEVEVPAAHAPVVADVDGDGYCEILLGCLDGRVRVFK